MKNYNVRRGRRTQRCKPAFFFLPPSLPPPLPPHHQISVWLGEHGPRLGRKDVEELHERSVGTALGKGDVHARKGGREGGREGRKVGGLAVGFPSSRPFLSLHDCLPVLYNLPSSLPSSLPPSLPPLLRTSEDQQGRRPEARSGGGNTNPRTCPRREGGKEGGREGRREGGRVRRMP